MKRLLFVGLVVGCASGNAVAHPASSEPIEGTYEYVAALPGQRVLGRLRVVGDTMIVEAQADYCTPVIGSRDPIAMHYACNGPGRFENLRLTFDRRNPAQFSKWAANLRVQKTREVCVRYETQNGRQVCMRTRQESYEEIQGRTGNLQVRKVR